MRRVRDEIDARRDLALEEIRRRVGAEQPPGGLRARGRTWAAIVVVALAGAAVAGMLLAERASLERRLAAADASAERRLADRDRRIERLESAAVEAAGVARALRVERDGLRRDNGVLSARIGETAVLQGTVERLRRENARLRAEIDRPPVDAGERPPPGVRPVRPGTPVDVVVVTPVRTCRNAGTPLEDCFDCPGDDRCRP
jgi:hypothetical protein